MLFKLRWLKDWFVYDDYTSGEMIRTWLLINNLRFLHKYWRKHMIRRLNARY